MGEDFEAVIAGDRNQRDAGGLGHADGERELETMEQATIKEKCPGCGNEEMNYHTLQLRSADEGTTVFYDCPKCGYKFSQNN